MEYHTQKYQFNQDGGDYVVSTGLVGDRIRITCQESLALDGPFYSGEFSLDDLRRINQFFMLPQTPEEALLEINKGIERQKSGLSKGNNDTMIFIGYLVIGTDKDAYNLPLRRDYEPNKYGIFTPPSSGAADLVLQSNYKVDGKRLNLSEAKCGDLQSEQTALEEELNIIIPEINKLRKLSLDIKEENALIKERLKILQEQLEERKRVVFKLKEENENLKRENQELSNYIKNQENEIREKQAIQTTIKVKPRPNIDHGKSAITSKFEQSALRTFLPRAAIKPITEDYIQSNTTYITGKPTTIINTTTAQVQPTQKLKYSTSTYTINPIYTYNNPISKATSYTKIPEIKDAPYTSKFGAERDVPYTSHFGAERDVPYTSKTGISATGVKDAPYTSHFGAEKDVPYTSKFGAEADVPYTSKFGAERDVPYTSKFGAEADAPYTSKFGAEADVPYTSKFGAERDAPYTSKTTKKKGGGKDSSYTSHLGAERDVAYGSASLGDKDKNVPYSSEMANQAQKSGANTSQMSNNSNLGGYSSQMANNLGDSTNAGYSSQMAQTSNKNIQGNPNKRPKGSGEPDSPSSKLPVVGYSSYK